MGSVVNNHWRPQFLFAACQHGAEGVLKGELYKQFPGVRPAFARPGFVTFKLPEPCENPSELRLRSTFARTYGFSLGEVQGNELRAMAGDVYRLPEMAEFLTAHPTTRLHVWQRDAAAPGEGGFEPGTTPLAAEVRELVQQLQAPGGDSGGGRWILDVVLNDPNHWWIGCHSTTHRTARWPGGVPSLSLPEHAVSRTYLKMKEALRWSTIPIAAGETCIELGCAPGGAAQALLETGLLVTGVDPGEVDPVVLADPSFLHVRRRTTELRRRDFRGVRWVVADMIVAPTYTLDAVEQIVKDPESAVRGLILTLKLSDWQQADELPAYVERVKSWGMRDVRTRQLAFNRREVCLVALRSRAQRRLRRGKQRRSVRRHDRPHSPASGGPHIAADM